MRSSEAPRAAILSVEQREGARFLAARRLAMLADAPGFGKSGQIVRACDYIGAEAVTGIVPNRTLALNMAREFGKWSLSQRWPVTILRDRWDEVPARGLVLTTYALCIQPRIRKQLRARPVDALFCDEAHWLKETTAKCTVATLGEAGFAHSAKHVWLATGTPIPNHAGELFVLAKAGGVWLGNYAAFVEEFCITREDSFGTRIIGTKNHEKIKALLDPVLIRRVRKADAPLISDLVVEATADPYAQLGAIERELIEQAIAAEDMSFADVPALSSVRRLVGLAKAEGVAELAAADLQGGYAKVLIFCQHTDVIRLINEKLQRFGSDIFDGKITPAHKERSYWGFINDPAQRVRVCQMKAAGEGLDGWQHVCRRAILAEPSWTPKDNEQAICRVARQGQTQPVHASYVSLAGSLDERITATRHRKAADIARIL